MSPSRPHLASIASPLENLPGRRAPQDQNGPADGSSVDGAVREGVRALMDPLSVVVGFAELLVEGGDDADEQRRFARRVHEAARQLEQQVRRLEAITRADGERVEQLPLF